MKTEMQQTISGNKVDKTLSRTECRILRGLAIAGIVLHNYCHWLRHVVQENEYQFNQHNVDWFNRVMAHHFDHYTLLHLLSYFGHYGVPVFLFLSAYGLVIKYEVKIPQEMAVNPSYKEPSIFSFFRYHFLKLFRMMIVGFSCFVLVDAITPGPHRYQVLDIIGQMGLFNNLLPNPDDIIWPGPYWFFGLMMQLYIVYRLFLYKKNWTWVVAFIVICTVLELLCDPNGETINRLRYNFIGGMLPFGLGLLYAKYMRNLHISAFYLIFVISLFGVWYGDKYYFTWLFVPMFICSLAVSFVKIIMSWNNKNPEMKLGVANKSEWLGGLSAAMFISHPITRKIIIPISKSGDLYTGLLLYVITSICVAWLFKEFMKQVPSPKLK